MTRSSYCVHIGLYPWPKLLKQDSALLSVCQRLITFTHLLKNAYAAILLGPKADYSVLRQNHTKQVSPNS